MMGALTLYARRVPVASIPHSSCLAAMRAAGWTEAMIDRATVVALYRDEAMTDRCAYFQYGSSSAPRPSHRRVMFNCYRWRLIWPESVGGRRAA